MRGNIGVGRVSGRYYEWPLQGWRGQRENISHLFSWLCCSWVGKKKDRDKDLSVPWCVPRGDSGGVCELWVGNWGLWGRERVVHPRRQYGKFGFSC